MKFRVVACRRRLFGDVQQLTKTVEAESAEGAQAQVQAVIDSTVEDMTPLARALGYSPEAVRAEIVSVTKVE